MNILRACDDPNLFGGWFKNETSWEAWRAFLASLFGLEMSDSQLETFRACTALDEPPAAPFSEGWLICGRRAGKSFIMALVAVWLACFKSYAKHLAPGERGTVLVLAADRKQARVIIRYISAMLNQIPMLKRMVERQTAEAFDLSNRTTIEVGTASYRTTRGYTFVAVLCDELAFWRSDDSASPDYEVLNAIRPGMSTIPGAMLLCASSPYSRRGALWDAFNKHYGKEDGPLVWRAPTRTMNPTVSDEFVAAELERDPSAAAAEYLAEFRSDLEQFLTHEAVMACVERGLRERPPERKHEYVGFVDPSGGSSDAFSLAIAHRENKTAILDLVRDVRPPFSPESITSEFATELKRYRISKVYGDRYGGQWPREAFRRHGIHYEPAGKSKSELYVDLLPLINSQAGDLLDEPKLVAQLVGLERKTTRGGRDSIDHAPGAHDDLANSVAGALVRAFAKLQPTRSLREMPTMAKVSYEHMKRRRRGRENEDSRFHYRFTEGMGG